MKHIYRLLLKLLGGKIRRISLTEEQQTDIETKIWQINGIEDYLNLHSQQAYQDFAKTRNEKYLGISEFCENLLRLFEYKRERNNTNLKVENNREQGYDLI